MVSPLRTAGPLRALACRPPPAPLWALGGRASTDASGSALRLREEGAEATTPALTEPAAVVADGGAPAEGGSPKGSDLALAADPTPGECLSEARYRLLHHTAVSFVSSDIRVFLIVIKRDTVL